MIAKRKRMDLVLASRNPMKAEELRDLLAGIPVNIRSLDEFPHVRDVEEDGRTFTQNAVKKARYVARETGLPALADDSGLEVDALDGAPGVRSARYAGEDSDDLANNSKLLRSLEGTCQMDRSARFRCVIALAWPDGKVDISEGSCEGLITDTPRGKNGFGYDPLFFYPPLGRTFAELESGEKHRVSHRGKALEGAARIIRLKAGE